MTVTIDLSGHTALVTGAGQHTGREFSLGLASAGAHVLVNDVVEDKAAGVVEEIRSAGGAADSCVFDVTDVAAVEAALAERPADIVVNNVGGTAEITFPFVRFHESDPERWNRLIELNTYGVFNTTYAALPHMRESGWGRIITIVSDAARRGERGMAVYGAAKAAAAGFTRMIAAEYGVDGVTANCLAFGTLRYAGTPDMDDEQLRRMLRGYAVRRQGKPSDPVGLLLMLASDGCEWVTGQVIPVDGGYTNAL